MTDRQIRATIHVCLAGPYKRQAVSPERLAVLAGTTSGRAARVAAGLVDEGILERVGESYRLAAGQMELP